MRCLSRIIFLRQINYISCKALQIPTDVSCSCVEKMSYHKTTASTSDSPASNTSSGNHTHSSKQPAFQPTYETYLPHPETDEASSSVLSKSYDLSSPESRYNSSQAATPSRWKRSPYSAAPFNYSDNQFESNYGLSPVPSRVKSNEAVVEASNSASAYESSPYSTSQNRHSFSKMENTLSPFVESTRFDYSNASPVRNERSLNHWQDSDGARSAPGKLGSYPLSPWEMREMHGQNPKETEVLSSKSCRSVDVGNSPLLDMSSTPKIRSEKYLDWGPTGSSHTSCKRPRSVIDEYDLEDGKNEENNYGKDNAIRSPENSFRRQSLPNVPTSITPTNYSTSSSRYSCDRRQSFPLSKFASSSIFSQKRSCTTDQTPYAEDYDRRKRMRFSLPSYNAQKLLTLKSEHGFIDSHCHLDFLFNREVFSGTLSEYKELNKETFPDCYRGCLAIFCNPITFQKEYFWKKYLQDENVWASFGCHPHNARDYTDDVEKSLCLALEHPKVRALGEIGLDYSNRNNCMKEVQFEAFRRQLKIVLRKKLPVVIHCREAHEDAIRIIKEILPTDFTIHLHCFTDTWEWAEKWLEEFPNLCIGLTNVVTFPSAENVHEVAKQIPLDRLLLETDAPYFIPKVSARGMKGARGNKCAHPGMAIHVAAQVAALRNIPIEEVLKSTRINTKRVYNI